nr:mitotic interactor and substrate of PLK1-like [Zonotrichia albicollis]
MHFTPCSCSPRLGPRHGVQAVTKPAGPALEAGLGQGLTLLWVSTPWEWNRGHPPNALSLTAASGASGHYSVSESPASSPASHQPGILGLISSFTPLRVTSSSQGSAETLTPDSSHSSPFEERRRRVKEDGKYAGIEPVDKVNTEVVESTRVFRHKSAMAQRWEAGQYVRDED